jgi:hypothetical protein
MRVHSDPRGCRQRVALGEAENSGVEKERKACVDSHDAAKATAAAAERAQAEACLSSSIQAPWHRTNAGHAQVNGGV